MASVRIMSWNVKLTLDATDAYGIGGVIVDENPDIVCMQESRQQRLQQPAGVYEYLRTFRWASAGQGDGNIYEHHTTNIGTSTGNTIVSRIPLTGKTFRDFGVASPTNPERRTMQRAQVTLPGGGTFFIYNTHVSQSQLTEQNPIVLQRKAALLYADESQPVSKRIVCGDFNANRTLMFDPENSGWGSGSRWLDFDDPAYRPTVPASGAGTEKVDWIFRLRNGMDEDLPKVIDNKVSDHKALFAIITGI